MKNIKHLALLSTGIFLTSCLMFTSCGEEDSALQVVVCAPYVDEEMLDSYEAALLEANPTWAEDGTKVEFQAMSVGSEDSDPSVYAASIMKISAMVAAKEVDVMICDMEDAARNARGEMYLDLDTVFTNGELDAYADSILSFELLDDNNSPTGEMTPNCGVELTGKESLSDIFGDLEYGAFIVGNTQNLEFSKEVFLEILNS